MLALLLAAPALKVRLGAADAGTAPKSQTTRQAYDILSDKKDGFGPGFTSPITVVVKGGAADANKVYNALAGPHRIEGQHRLRLEAVREQGRRRQPSSTRYSRFSPQDAKTDDLVSQLREQRRCRRPASRRT